VLQEADGLSGFYLTVPAELPPKRRLLKAKFPVEAGQDSQGVRPGMEHLLHQMVPGSVAGDFDVRGKPKLARNAHAVGADSFFAQRQLGGDLF
jgi:hypothetical protein